MCVTPKKHAQTKTSWFWSILEHILRLLPRTDTMQLWKAKNYTGRLPVKTKETQASLAASSHRPLFSFETGHCVGWEGASASQPPRLSHIRALAFVDFLIPFLKKGEFDRRIRQGSEKHSQARSLFVCFGFLFATLSSWRGSCCSICALVPSPCHLKVPRRCPPGRRPPTYYHQSHCYTLFQGSSTAGLVKVLFFFFAFFLLLQGTNINISRCRACELHESHLK